MYSQYSRRNLGSIICLVSPHVRASVMDHGQEGRVCVITFGHDIACVKITFKCSAQVLVLHRNSP